MSNIYKCYSLHQFNSIILEHANSVWNPYQYNKIYIIDRIQRRATHWSLCNYDRYSSVTLMQHQLNWQNLQQCQQIVRLLLLYKALHNFTALQIATTLLQTKSFYHKIKQSTLIYLSLCKN